MTRALLLLACLAFSGNALAADPPADVRRVALSDGRELLGEVVTTEPGGIRLRVPQGEVLVPFHQLSNVAPGDAAAWSRQRDWEVVVVGPEAERRWVEQAIRTFPATKVTGDSGLSQSLPSGVAAQARNCAPTDLSCAVKATARDRLWVWVVSVDPGEKGATLRAQPSTGASSTSAQVADLYDAGALIAALDKVMGLKSVPGQDDAIAQLQAVAPVKGKVAKVKPPKKPKDPGPTKPDPKATGDKVADVKKPKPDKPGTAPAAPSAGLVDSFVPLPGYPALKRGDMGAFGLSLAVALPVTAAWIGVSGSQSQSAREHILLSAGGFYLATVVVNQTVSGSGGNLVISRNSARRSGRHAVASGGLVLPTE